MMNHDSKAIFLDCQSPSNCPDGWFLTEPPDDIWGNLKADGFYPLDCGAFNFCLRNESHVVNVPLYYTVVNGTLVTDKWFLHLIANRLDHESLPNISIYRKEAMSYKMEFFLNWVFNLRSYFNLASLCGAFYVDKTEGVLRDDYFGSLQSDIAHIATEIGVGELFFWDISYNNIRRKNRGNPVLVDPFCPF